MPLASISPHGICRRDGRRCWAVREAARSLHRTVSVIQDLQGPRIRVGRLVEGRPIPLRIGAELRIVSRDIEGTEDCISTTYDQLATDVRPGDGIWLDDGRLRLRVLSVGQDEVVTSVEVGGLLGEHKGINLPGVSISVPSITDADREHLRYGVTELDVDYIAMSIRADRQRPDPRPGAHQRPGWR